PTRLPVTFGLDEPTGGTDARSVRVAMLAGVVGPAGRGNRAVPELDVLPPVFPAETFVGAGPDAVIPPLVPPAPPVPVVPLVPLLGEGAEPPAGNVPGPG